MKCTTPYCKNDKFSVWHAPEGYSLATYKGEPMHHCPACGAKWRGDVEIATAVLHTGGKGKLYDFLKATKEFHAGRDNSMPTGYRAGGSKE